MKSSSPTHRVIRALGQRLAPRRSLNRDHAPVGMLELDRILKVAPPISTITSRPLSTAFTSLSTKV